MFHLFYIVPLSAPLSASHLLHVVHLLEDSFSSAETIRKNNEHLISNVITQINTHCLLCMSSCLLDKNHFMFN